MIRFLLAIMVGGALGVWAVLKLLDDEASHSPARRYTGSDAFDMTHDEDAPEVNRFPVLSIDPAVLDEITERAEYEWLNDSDGWAARVPGFQGAWANGTTREQAREELKSVLQEWISLSVWKGIPLPAMEGLDLAAAVRQ